MRKRWWAQIPRNGLRPWNLRWDPSMRTKYRLWLTCPMIGESLRINGSSRGRRMLIVVLLSTKLELSQNVFDKFKVLTTMRFSHSYRCLKVYANHVSSFHILWNLANGCEIVFLNGFIKEELYMLQPEGFVNPKGANKICKLQRSIYGLVQASRSWNICFDELIKAYSFIQTCGEACIYKKVSGSTTAFLISISEWHIVDRKWCRIFWKA